MSDFSLSLLSGGDRLAKRITREEKVAVFYTQNEKIKEVWLLELLFLLKTAMKISLSELRQKKPTCMLANQGGKLDSLPHGAHLFLLE